MDASLMENAVLLAEKGIGKVKNRPLVGCVIARGKKVVGTGYHGERGRKHAEAIALEKAGKRARGADLYCTLEPCAARGYTGSCAEKIIKAGVKNAFIGCLDPNPKNRKKGAKKLVKAGIRVKIEVLGQRCRKQNNCFNKWIKTGKPFVVLKSALTRDGFISWGDGKKKKITGKKADKLVQNYRAKCDCILVGIGTVLKDNPGLACRKKNFRNPVRVVLDPLLEIPLGAKMFKEKGKTIVFHARGANPGKRKKLEKKGIECVSVKKSGRGLELESVLKKLGEKKCMGVLVEGGQKINTSFLEKGLVDKIVLFFSRKEVGYGLKFCEDSLSKSLKLKGGSIRELGKDILVEGYLK